MSKVLDEELPEGWVKTTFGDVILTISNGINGNQSKDALGLPVTRIETIANKKVNFKKIGYIAIFDESKIEKYRLQIGDILFSHINSPSHLGKTALFESNIPLYHGINLLRIVVNRKIIYPNIFNYFCVLTRFNGEFAMQAQHAVNQASINQKKLALFPFFLPPFAEQEEIAKRIDILLKHVDAIKSIIDVIPNILKDFRQSVLYAAVSGKLTEDWRGGETNFIKSCLKDLGQMTGGKTPNKSNKLFWQNGNIPWVSPKDMKFLEITSSQDLITDLAVTEASMQLLPEKTILMVTRSGILAHTFPVAITKIKVSINQDIKAFIPDANKVSAEFISIILRGLSYDILNSCSKSGTTVPSIETNALLKYKLNIPPLEEQTEIVRRVEEYFKLADSIEAKIKAAQVHINFLTQSILYQAFKGNLTKDWRAENQALISGENSAERLLDKIKAEKGKRT